MFSFITKTWNPLGGECHHNCAYCWAKRLIGKFGMQKYVGIPHLIHRELKRIKSFNKDDFVFVCDMIDLFGEWVHKTIIQQILDYISQSPATFLLLTKNPARYLEFKIPENCVCGATVETDYDFDLANAPSRIARMRAMYQLKHPRKMIAIEPIMYFSPEFGRLLLLTNPEFVAIGYDNYNNNLKEPHLEITKILISMFEAYEVKVYKKTLREPFLEAKP